MVPGGLSAPTPMPNAAGGAADSSVAGLESVPQSYPSSNDNVSQLQMELLRSQPGQHDPSQFPSSSSQHAMGSFQIQNYEPQLAEVTSANTVTDTTQAPVVPQFVQYASGRGRGSARGRTKRTGKRDQKRDAASDPTSPSGPSAEAQPIFAPQAQYPFSQLNRSISDPYPPTGFAVSSQAAYPSEFPPHAGNDAAQTGDNIQFTNVFFGHNTYSVPAPPPPSQEHNAFSIASSASTGLTYDPSISFSSPASQGPDITYSTQSQGAQTVAFSPSSSRPSMRLHNTALPTIQELMHLQINRQEDGADPAGPLHQQPAEQDVHGLPQQPEASSSGLVESRRPSFNTVLKNFIESLDSSSPAGQGRPSTSSLGFIPMGQGSSDLLRPVPLPAWQPNPLLPPIPEHEHPAPHYSLLHSYNDPPQMVPNAIVHYQAHPVERATLAYDPTWMNGDTPTPEFESKL